METSELPIFDGFVKRKLTFDCNRGFLARIYLSVITYVFTRLHRKLRKWTPSVKQTDFMCVYCLTNFYSYSTFISMWNYTKKNPVASIIKKKYFQICQNFKEPMGKKLIKIFEPEKFHHIRSDERCWGKMRKRKSEIEILANSQTFHFWFNFVYRMNVHVHNL